MADNNTKMVEGLKGLAEVFAPGSEAEAGLNHAFHITLPRGRESAAKVILQHLEKLGFNGTGFDGLRIGSATHDSGRRIDITMERAEPAVFNYLARMSLPYAIKAAQKELGIPDRTEPPQATKFRDAIMSRHTSAVRVI